MIRNLIGVMGPGEQATDLDVRTAYALGQGIATNGWVLLTGGRATGVMAAASQGAHSAGGLVVGILPDETIAEMSSDVDIPIVTGMGQARNVVNILSSRVVVACGLGAGTLSEIALAIKHQKPVVLMQRSQRLYPELQPLAAAPVMMATTVEGAIGQIDQWLKVSHSG